MLFKAELHQVSSFLITEFILVILSCEQISDKGMKSFGLEIATNLIHLRQLILDFSRYTSNHMALLKILVVSGSLIMVSAPWYRVFQAV